MNLDPTKHINEQHSELNRHLKVLRDKGLNDIADFLEEREKMRFQPLHIISAIATLPRHKREVIINEIREDL